MSRHFCFCIPVRIAVFILSFLTFLSAGVSAFAFWALVHFISTNQLEKLEQNMDDSDKQAFEAFLHKYMWAIVGASVFFTLISLIGLFGFIGSIIRNRRMVKAYSALTIVGFVLSVAGVGFTLFFTWRSSPFCVTVNGVESCFVNAFNKSQKIGYTVGVLLELLIQLYMVIIIRRYVEQLEEEREYRHDFRLNPTSGGTYEAKEGLLTQGGHYPYSDSSNAFGTHK
ncbi:hypothetical protein C8Q80DRAFT_1177647 [Daedaleopsis nitida]|nr:hypothetical protein C8Q80DRAFT_1177647 [Daedaleopsis nitida]